MECGSRRAVVAALPANGGITIAEFLAFAVTGAASMLADGGPARGAGALHRA